MLRRTFTLAVYFLATLGAAMITAVADEYPFVMPRPADSFVDAIGFDTHFNYHGTPYVERWPTMRSRLVESGVRHIRDGAPTTDSGYVDRLRALGERGIKHSIGFSIGASSDVIRAALKQFEPYVDFVEPANEYDEAAKVDPRWVQRVTLEQQTLFATVHGQPDLEGMTVLGPSLAHGNYAQLGGLDTYEDAGNLHSYLCRNPDSGRIADAISSARASTNSKPIWTTETGYGDNPTRNCWLPDAAIAKYAPRLVAESLKAGEPRVYFYQFADIPSDLGFGATGFIKADGQPKPQYTALVSLMSVLSDPGPTFRPKALQIGVVSPARDVDHLLLQKRSGVYELLLWREVQDSRATVIGGVTEPVAPVLVTISSPNARATNYLTYDAAWALKDVPFDHGASGHTEVPVTDAISVLELR